MVTYKIIQKQFLYLLAPLKLANTENTVFYLECIIQEFYIIYDN